MMCIALKLLLLLAFTYQTDATLASEYDHSAFLDVNEAFKLYWSVKDADKSIHCAVEVKTTGWVGFGISKGLSGTMKDSDIVMGWVDSKGKSHIMDTYATGHSLPSAKETQDYHLVGGSEQNGVTVLKFKRKLVTCDKNDRDIPLGTTKVIYAYGATDKLSYHSERGARSVNLLNYVKDGPPPSTAKQFEIISKDVPVPAVVTTYWCQPFKLSNLVKLNETRHVIEIAPVVAIKDQGVVHHMVLYSCPDTFNETHLNVKGPCRHPNMPSSIRSCYGGVSIFAWAVGGTNFKFPSHVGLPIGASYSFKYMLLETHFDNPTASNKFVITTGLKMYYDAPRKYEAATLTTGIATDVDLLIPPKQPNWVLKGYCSKECSAVISNNNKSINGNELRFFASFPHAHTTGNGIKTNLVRNGKEVANVIEDDNYDFNFQQTHLLRKEIPYRAGDGLVTYCRYNTMNRDDAVTGGESTKEEMCLNFIMYYPRIDATFCATKESRISKQFSRKYAKQEIRTLFGKSRLSFSNWTGVKWTDAMVGELKDIYAYNGADAVATYCPRPYRSNSTSRPEVTTKLAVPKQDCTKQPSAAVVNAGNSFLFSVIISLTVAAVALTE